MVKFRLGSNTDDMRWLNQCRNWTRRLARDFKRASSSPDLDELGILGVLSRLPDFSGSAVMVHSSLSACGIIQQGAAAVVSALRQWTSGKLLAMPAHSYCYPDADGTVRVFDPARTPSVVGAVTDLFWRQADVVRSLHSTHSLAAAGPGARQLVAGHERADTPCGAGTPYERLVEADAGVLMFGVSLESYTLFHTAEALAGVPYLYHTDPVELRYKSPDGMTHVMCMRRQDMGVRRRFSAMDRWMQERGLLHRVKCGRGELLWLPHARSTHDALTRALRSAPWLLVADKECPLS